GGQVGISDHLTIGNHVIAAAQTGISKNLPDGAFVSGSPASNIQDWRKACASIPHLYELIRDVRKLKKRVEELEKKE
ncbi:MAG: UDP-3-O-(3-hydroxymyristoyl)glucosamine N-acyltransferase, partial [Candidatus Aminicenantes bacterium]|nr:UDP-3-O-(3-hydroxymyristoyl)glucosamine N-acyltransferase [Candidatus Aminicenantes bacterium]